MLNALLDWLKRSIFGRPRTPPGVSPFAAGTGPERLLIMRHAEKTGEKSDRHLSAAGQQRAEKLASYIPQQFGTPDFLMAAANSKRSRRPRETLEPLASVFGLEIFDQFDDEDVDPLVEFLGSDPIYAGAFGVISWRHSDIPQLMAALGAPDGSYPDPWPEAEYALILEITYAADASPRVRKIQQPF